MPVIVIAAHRPKPGQDNDLLACVKDHMPTLRSQGLITDRAPVFARAEDGTVIEIFEWKSQEAIDEAHCNPVVQELWQRFAQCSQYIAPAEVPGFTNPFPGLEPIDA